MLPLIAPRPLPTINGEVDPRTPMPGLRECADAARAAFRAAGVEERFVLHIQPHTGHKVLPASMTRAMRYTGYREPLTNRHGGINVPFRP